MIRRVALLTSFILPVSMLGAPRAAIGIVTASGHFTLENSRIWGHATLFEGASVRTDDASSELALKNGVTVHLGANSAARIWKDRLVLESGVGQVSGAAFQLNARGVRIAGQRFRVGLGERLEVAALSGAARMFDDNGAVLASIPAGRSMSFALLQTVTRAGCLLYKDGGFILDVDDSPEVIQLNGPDLARNVGNRVQVTGATAATDPTIAPATSVVTVTGVSTVSAGGCLTSAAALNAQTSVPQQAAPVKPGAPAPQPPKTAGGGGGGMSTGAKVAIVAAIAGGGAGAALALGGKKDSTSP